MAIASLQIPQSNINNLVDQSQWSSLANLGNVYRDAQAAQAKRTALASLGTDPKTNLQTLLTSGDPTLAQLGLSLQEKGVEQQRETDRYKITDARANAELALRQAAGRREQGTYDQAEQDRLNAASVIGGMSGAAPPQAAPPQAAFPAPLPQAQPTPPPQAVPPVAAPSAFGATPPLPATLQAPPVKAEGDDPSALPGWVQSAQEAPPDTSIAGRAASNLASPHPTAAAGISREQLGAMYANPLTRPLATAFLQKQLDPGTYTFQQVGDKLVRTNSKTGVSDVVMTDTKPTKLAEGERLIQGGQDVTPGGFVPKAQQERDARFADAKARGYDDTTANYVAINGKLPKEDLTPGEMTEINKKSEVISNGQNVVDNIQMLKDLSKTSYSGWAALPRAQVQNILPEWAQSQRSIDTQELTNIAHQNVAQQAKATFGARITNLDLQLLKELETSADQPDALRQKIYTRVEKMLNGKVRDATAEVEGIRNKTYYKPGGGAAPSMTSGTPALNWKIVP